jgi:dihydroorotase
MPKLPERIELSPGVDIHAHLREPSPINTSETFESGTYAAQEGGYLAVFDMPNNPGAETWTLVAIRDKEGRIIGFARVYTGVNAGSQPNSNNESEFEGMARYAASLKSFYGGTTNNIHIWEQSHFKEIHTQWHRVAPELPILVHRGNADLEEIMAFVCGELRHQLHICHVNSMDEVMAVKRGKSRGYDVTCGVTPHHLFMDTHDLKTKGELAQVMPPLASEVESNDLWDALVKGDIDLVETDHAPHSFKIKLDTEAKKIRGEDTADCSGIAGIQETIPQFLYQAAKGRITLKRIDEVISKVPARVMGIEISRKSKSVFSNELYSIEETDPRREYASVYIGNWAVGHLQEMYDKDGVLFFNGKPIRRPAHPFIRRGATI